MIEIKLMIRCESTKLYMNYLEYVPKYMPNQVATEIHRVTYEGAYGI